MRSSQVQRLQWSGHVERMDKEKGPVNALCFNLDGTKKSRLRRRWKKGVERDMTARGLLRIDEQDRTQWKRGCKNWLTSACREELPSPRKKKIDPHSGAKRWQ